MPMILSSAVLRSRTRAMRSAVESRRCQVETSEAARRPVPMLLLLLVLALSISSAHHLTRRSLLDGVVQAAVRFADHCKQLVALSQVGIVDVVLLLEGRCRC